jgi:phosphoglucomutase
LPSFQVAILSLAGGGWFAARPSGTEDIVKLYAESYRSEAHLGQIVPQARLIISPS